MADNVPFYLLIPSIKGGGTETEHKEWIPILAFTAPMPLNQTSGGAPSTLLYRINFIAPSDVSFPSLMRSASTSDSFDSAQLDRLTTPKGDSTLLRLTGPVIVDCRTTKSGFSFTLQAESIAYGPASAPVSHPLDRVGYEISVMTAF